MIYEVEWTSGEEIAPGMLAWWSAKVEADSPEDADAKIDQLEAEMRQMGV